MPLDAVAPPAPPPADGHFDFLGHSRNLGAPPDWNAAGAPRLWLYHLHYFDWAWAIEDDSEFRSLWGDWRARVRWGRGDPWSPYVVSLRLWQLCSRLRADDRAAAAAVSAHAGYVRAHLEYDVGGNHLIKNLKALVGAGVFLGDDRLVDAGISRIATQVPIQVLDDGGHYERSPSYHCQVLGDFLDVEQLLAAAGRGAVPGLRDAIARMRVWLGAMLLPDGDVPLFNDCTLVGPERLAALVPAPADPAPLQVLADSGYVVVRPDRRVHLVIDVGPPCPERLPAHAHADCLSFQLAVDGRRVIVDSGTSTYERGARRQHERSTAAHNTVELDGEDQTEVWGAFRAARRAAPLLEAANRTDDRIEVIASHDGYERLAGRPSHRRQFIVTPGLVEILDTVEGSGDHDHSAVARLHLREDNAAAIRVEVVPNRVDQVGEIADGFGKLHAARIISTSIAGRLPLELHTHIRTET